MDPQVAPRAPAGPRPPLTRSPDLDSRRPQPVADRGRHGHRGRRVPVDAQRPRRHLQQRAVDRADRAGHGHLHRAPCDFLRRRQYRAGCGARDQGAQGRVGAVDEGSGMVGRPAVVASSRKTEPESPSTGTWTSKLRRKWTPLAPPPPPVRRRARYGCTEPRAVSRSGPGLRPLWRRRPGLRSGRGHRLPVRQGRTRCRGGRSRQVAVADLGSDPYSAADGGRQTRRMVEGSPAWKPQATLALVTSFRRASSSPSRQRPKPSPRSALRSIILRTTVRPKTEPSPLVAPVPSLPQCPE